MKVCSKCKLPKEKYYRKTNGKEYTFCVECQNEYSRDHYRRNRDQYYERNQRALHALHAKMLDYFSRHPCVDCGESDVMVLEFDHVNGEKQDNVSTLLRFNSWKAIEKEIEKCVVRCANCHKRRTHANSYRKVMHP